MAAAEGEADPFESLRVLEIAGSDAGAYAARLFADLGAQVTLVVPHADAAEAPARHFYLDAGKRVARVDDAAPDHDATLAAWIAWADVTIESAATGPLEPRTRPGEPAHGVRVLVSPMGPVGPLRGLRSNGFTDAALSGHLLLNGHPDREPIARPGRHSHGQAGLHAFVGALAALHVRDRTGRGDTVEVSHLAGLASLHQHTICMWTHGGHVLRRQGNRQPGYWHPAGVYACADGHVVVAATGQAARDRLLAASGLAEALLDPRFADDLALARHKDAFDALLEPWLSARTAEEIVDTLQAARVPAGAVATPGDLLADPHLDARGFFATVEGVRVPARPFLLSHRTCALRASSTLPDGARPPADPPPARPNRADGGSHAARPLAGVRVLDLGRVWAGPLAGRLLADLGADVILVETPDARGGRKLPADLGEIAHLFPEGDPGERPWNRLGAFNELHRNERSLALDLDRPEAAPLLERLVARADVVLENASPGAMAARGLGFERLAAVNPRLVYTAISGFGQTGPHRDRVALGPVIEACSGAADAMGYADGGPIRSGVAWPDPLAALHAVAATLVALRDRDADAEPRPRLVDVAMLESSAWLLGDRIADAQRDDSAPERCGNRDRASAPQGVYPCRGEDRWIAISVASDAEWRALCACAGLGEALAALDAPARRARHDEIDAALSAYTRDQDRWRLTHRLQAAGIVCGPLADAKDLCENEQLDALGFWLDVDHPDTGTRRQPGCAIRLAGAPGPPSRPAPRLGEHNRTILREILGMADPEVTALEQSGVLVDRPPS